ncbi:DUF2119 domain-containing protein [Methanosarcina sp. T3]|uniref:DUF2119 domain-containing protein n=1 Tax=Methanosarcina sp. T3 TaxID=3439062 RepID=UPI003F8527FD
MKKTKRNPKTKQSEEKEPEELKRMKVDEKAGSFPNDPGCTDTYTTHKHAKEIGLKVHGQGKPVRLFVAGLHGDEWKDTTEILQKIEPPEKGTLAVIPLVSRGEYISTLDPAYYPVMGADILKAVETLNPEVYIELHSYSGENLEKLAGRDRLERIGVPAYSVLKAGVLLGSVSPWIRRGYFPKEALCLSFEIQKGNPLSREFVAGMLEVLKKTGSRDEFIEYLRKEFPEQAKKAIEDYRRFYGEI